MQQSSPECNEAGGRSNGDSKSRRRDIPSPARLASGQSLWAVESVDLVHSGLELSYDIGVGRFVKADVAVADLDKTKIRLRVLHSGGKGWACEIAQAERFQHPPASIQRAPVPAQAMHFRNPRQSMPSLLWSCSI